MGSNSKITLIEKLLMAILVGSADLADYLAILGTPLMPIGPALPFISWFYGFTISVIMIFWLIMKGVSIRWFLGGSGIELVPFLNGLPARSGALLATFVEDSAPPAVKTALGAATGKPTAAKK
jgi:hypothetical protein